LISGFCQNVDEIFTLLGYYAEQNGNTLQMFQDNPLVPSSRDLLTLEDETNRLSQNVSKSSPSYAA
jgi:hypothetical protein